MANKKLFDAEVRTTPISTSQRIATGTAAGTTYNITVGNFRDWVIDAVPPYVPPLLTKVVNIGGWDMDVSSDTTKEVSLGVARNKIRSIVVVIQSNSYGLYTFAAPAGNDEVRQWWRVMTEAAYASNARIKMYSENGGYFDQSAFNGTSINRGYITVWYVA